MINLATPAQLASLTLEHLFYIMICGQVSQTGLQTAGMPNANGLQESAYHQTSRLQSTGRCPNRLGRRPADARRGRPHSAYQPQHGVLAVPARGPAQRSRQPPIPRPGRRRPAVHRPPLNAMTPADLPPAVLRMRPGRPQAGIAAPIEQLMTVIRSTSR